MRLYRHRVNTIEQLDSVPLELGVEFDLRSDGDRVIVTHDPFTDGPTIDEFFPRIGPRPCIFNVKCEGIESRVLETAGRHGISEFFFLDVSVPAAMKLVRQGEKRIAIRYSEVEPVESALAWAGKAHWVWVDCFTRFPTAPGAWASLAAHFEICLVSPELQGHGVESIPSMRASLDGLRYDAVCSKRPDLWTS